MPRTTLDLDASVLRELRRRSGKEHKSMGQLASELLSPALAQRSQDHPTKFSWTTARLGSPQVDLEDKEAVRALLED